MGWEIVASASSFDELEAQVADFNLPKGTRMLVTLDLILPIGAAFNIIGAEWLAKPFVPEGMDLIDVSGAGSKAFIELESDPIWLVAAILFIKAHWLALAILGFALWFLVSFIVITVKLPAVAQAPFLLLAGAAIGAIAIILIARKNPKVAAIAQGSRSP